MKYFKMVSGRGRVPMSEEEISEIFIKEDAPCINEPSEFEKLEKKVEGLSKTIEALSKTDIFKALCSLSERAEKENGAS